LVTVYEHVKARCTPFIDIYIKVMTEYGAVTESKEFGINNVNEFYDNLVQAIIGMGLKFFLFSSKSVK